MSASAEIGTPAADRGPTSCLECWFEFGSNYSYLSVMRIEALLAPHRIRLAWKPFLLGPIFRDLGWQSSPFVAQQEKGRYVWRDMERQAKKYGLDFRKPRAFPRKALLPTRVALANAGQHWAGEFCRRVMRQNWVEDTDIDNVGAVRRALEGLAPDVERLVDEAQGEPVKAALREQTAEAQRRGIFGAPSFFVGDEMFWGNDRLEDAIEFALELRIGKRNR